MQGIKGHSTGWGAQSHDPVMLEGPYGECGSDATIMRGRGVRQGPGALDGQEGWTQQVG